jgi:hypothetical protein
MTRLISLITYLILLYTSIANASLHDYSHHKTSANGIGDFYAGDNIANPVLDQTVHLGAHAALGCAMGAISDDCAAGAVGGVVGEGLAELTGNVNLSQFAGAMGGLLVGGDSEAVYTAYGTAVNAVQNNYLNHEHQDQWDKYAKEKCKEDPSSCAAIYKQYTEAEKMAESIGYLGDPDVVGCDALCHQMVMDFNMMPFEAVGISAVVMANSLIVKPIVGTYNSLDAALNYGAVGVDPYTGETVYYDSRTGQPLTEDMLNLSLVGVGFTAKMPAGYSAGTTTLKTQTGTSLVPYYPANNGFLGEVKTVTLQPGTLVDRYGPQTGLYVSPQGTPFTMRSLPQEAATSSYNIYEVLQPIKVETGTIAPAYGQVGFGTQNKLPTSIDNLINSGYLGKK